MVMTKHFQIARHVALGLFACGLFLLFWSAFTYQGNIVLFGAFTYLGLTGFLATESFGPISRRRMRSTLVIVRMLLGFSVVGLLVVVGSYMGTAFAEAAAAA